MAQREIGAIDKLLNRSKYLKKQYEETGVPGYFLDDRGWQAYLFGSTDYFLYVSILILFSGCFSIEYGRTPMSAILYTCAKGRKSVFTAKLISVTLLTVSMRTICELSAFFITAKYYGFPLADAPALSIETLVGLESDISLKGISLLIFAIRAASALLLGILVMFMSCICRKSLPAIAVSASVTLLPALGEYSGIDWFSNIDFLRLFDGGSVLLESIGRAGKTDFQLITVIFLLTLAVIAAIVFLGFKISCRKI